MIKRNALNVIYAIYFEETLSEEEYYSINDSFLNGDPAFDAAIFDLLDKNPWINSTPENDFNLKIIDSLLPSTLQPSDLLINEAKNYLEGLTASYTRLETLYQATCSLLAASSSDNWLHPFQQRLINIIDFSERIEQFQQNLNAPPLNISHAINLITNTSLSIDMAIEFLSSNTNKTWHFMFYMIADNDLETYAIQDLKEIQALVANSNISATVVLDRNEAFDTSQGDWTDTRYGSINESSENVSADLVSVGELNMTTPTYLTSFIDWSTQNFNADNFVLVLWDHGLGYDGIGIDYSDRGSSLSISNIKKAIESTQQGSVDTIIFDACNMATIETMAGLQHITNSIIASQDIVPNEGIDYAALSEFIMDSTTEDNVMQSILSSYQDTFNGLSTLALSELNTSYTFKLINALEQFIDTTIRSGQESDWSSIQLARSDSKFYFETKSIDFSSFLNNLVTLNINSDILRASNEMLSTLNKAIEMNVAEIDLSDGLSIYWPEESRGEYYDQEYELIAEELGLESWNNWLNIFWEV